MEQNRIDPEKTGKFIAALRKAHNMTQDQLGEKLFITRKAVSKWETGRACPSIDMLKLLSETLGVSLDDIIEGDFDKIEALLNNDNVLYKTNPPPEPKTGGKTIIISIIIVIIIFLMSNLKATKIYSIASEDDTYSIDNGVLVLSDVRSYIDLGTIYSNDDGLNGNSKYRYELCYKEKDNEKFILECGASRMVDIPKESKKLIMEILSKPKNNLFLKITKLDDMSEKQLNLLVEEKRNLDHDKFSTVAFGEMVLGKYNSHGLEDLIADWKDKEKVLEKDDSTDNEFRESIDLNILKEINMKEFKIKYNNQNIYKNNKHYYFEIDDLNNFFNVITENKEILFMLDTLTIRIKNGPVYSINNNYSIQFSEKDFDYENTFLLIEVIEVLKNL